VKRLILSASVVSIALGALWPDAAHPHGVVTTTVVFDREIVRILKKKCVVCHSDNNLAFPLTTYEQTRPWARSILEEVLRRRMPPWRALSGYAHFANGVGLTTRELQFITSWVEGNGPKTAGQTEFVSVEAAPKTPDERPVDVDFDRWELGAPDLKRKLDPAIIAADRSNLTKRTVVDLGLTSERWARALEFKPGDRRVVRAAFFSLEDTGQWLGSWTPWHGVTSLPAHTAYRLPAGTRIVAEIHYRGAGVSVEDRGTLGIDFANAAPANVPSDVRLEGSSEVPAHAKAHRVEVQETLPAGAYVLRVWPELPPGAQSIELSAKKPDGTVQILLFVKDVLPDWPTAYVLEEPSLLPKGTVLSAVSYHANPGDTPQAVAVRLTISQYGATSGSSTTNRPTAATAVPRRSR
jgi:hypothetical protein